MRQAVERGAKAGREGLPPAGPRVAQRLGEARLELAEQRPREVAGRLVAERRVREDHEQQVLRDEMLRHLRPH